MLIILQLILEGKLKNPILYVSYLFKLCRSQYCTALERVRNKDDYEQWVKFFLSALIENATDAISGITTLSQIVKKDREVISGQSQTIKKLFAYILSHPIITIVQTAKDLNFAFNTVSKAVLRLCDLGIMAKLNDKSRNRLYLYQEYLSVLKKDTENL